MKKLAYLFLIPGLMLASCTGNDSNGSGGTTITEEKFNEVIVNYGFAKGSATYDIEMTDGAHESMIVRMEFDNNKVKQFYPNYPEDHPVYNEIRGAEQDTYHWHTDRYEKTTNEFKGYFYDLGEAGMAFDFLAFSDFTYNADSSKYVLNEPKSHVYNFYGIDNTFYIDSLELGFNDNNLVSANITYHYENQETPYQSKIVGSKFGETTVTLPEV